MLRPDSGDPVEAVLMALRAGEEVKQSPWRVQTGWLLVNVQPQ